MLGWEQAFNYSFQNWFSPAVKAAFFFLLGGLFLGGGEWMYRKGRRIFSQGLLGGGVSILYGAIFYSYFGLNKLIGLEAGLVLSVLVTAITVGLSLRYDSPVVCGLGLVGGFLPFLTYAGALGMTGHACLAPWVICFPEPGGASILCETMEPHRHSQFSPAYAGLGLFGFWRGTALVGILLCAPDFPDVPGRCSCLSPGA